MPSNASKHDYAARGQEHVFLELRPFLTSDASPQGTSTGGGLSNDAFRTALSRARRRFGESLRAEIQETIADQEDVEDELRYLLRVLTT